MRALPKTKVCGLTNLSDAEQAINSGAEAVGFIAVKKSPRFIDAHLILEITDQLPKEVIRVAVFVDSDPQDVATFTHVAGCNVVQLCGQESVEDFADFLFPILRRIPADEAGLVEVSKWQSVAWGFVIDHPSSPGGSGIQVERVIARQLASQAPCLLAGGLDDTNVSSAIEDVRPAGVDASSRLETEPGKKDHKKVQEFINKAQELIG